MFPGLLANKFALSVFTLPTDSLFASSRDPPQVRLMLWDTAGQEEFDALTKSYYRGAQACVFAFSTTDRASLLAVKKWRKKVKDIRSQTSSASQMYQH